MHGVVSQLDCFVACDSSDGSPRLPQWSLNEQFHIHNLTLACRKQERRTQNIFPLSLLIRFAVPRLVVSSRWLSTGHRLPAASKVPFADSENAATTAKLDALTARIASMEQEMAFLRATNERLKELQSAEVNEV